MNKEKIYWILSLLSVLVTIAMIMIHYSDLPEKIPIHFNAQGIPDDYGKPSDLFGLPVLSIIVVLLMYWVNRKIIQLNPNKLGLKNQTQLGITRILIAQLALFCVLLFGWITFKSMTVAVGKTDSLGLWPMIISFFVPLLLLSLYFYRLLNASKIQ